jgi:hypothetical protein
MDPPYPIPASTGPGWLVKLDLGYSPKLGSRRIMHERSRVRTVETGIQTAFLFLGHIGLSSCRNGGSGVTKHTLGDLEVFNQLVKLRLRRVILSWMGASGLDKDKYKYVWQTSFIYNT